MKNQNEALTQLIDWNTQEAFNVLTSDEKSFSELVAAAKGGRFKQRAMPWIAYLYRIWDILPESQVRPSQIDWEALQERFRD